MSLKLLQLSGSKVLVVSFFLASWQWEQPASVQHFNAWGLHLPWCWNLVSIS
jgi:hypothetical protein